MNRYLYFIGFLTIPFFSSAQWPAYKYQRAIDPVKDSWHSVPLPEDIFSHIYSDMNDIRIYGITDSGDTIQAPYVLRSSQMRRTTMERKFEIRNVSHRESGSYFTLVMDDPKTINEISLSFSQNNYDWQVTVEGGNDGKDWFVLAEKQRIVDIHKPDAAFSYNRINIPRSDFKYYRLLIHGVQDAEMISASVNLNEIRGGKLERRMLDDFDYEVIDEKTDVYITLKNQSPVSRVQMFMNDTLDYFRPVSVLMATDSLRTESGYRYRYEPLMSGVLDSGDSTPMEFDPVLMNRLKIEITNLDNEPLQVRTAVVSGPEYHLMVRFEKKADYYLVYGRENDRKPQFDIERFDIPASATVIYLDIEEPVVVMNSKSSPLFEHSAWLWAVMGIVILVLGWYSYQMLTSE